MSFKTGHLLYFPSIGFTFRSFLLFFFFFEYIKLLLRRFFVGWCHYFTFQSISLFHLFSFFICFVSIYILLDTHTDKWKRERLKEKGTLKKIYCDLIPYQLNPYVYLRLNVYENNNMYLKRSFSYVLIYGVRQKYLPDIYST